MELVWALRGEAGRSDRRSDGRPHVQATHPLPHRPARREARGAASETRAAVKIRDPPADQRESAEPLAKPRPQNGARGVRSSPDARGEGGARRPK